ncbi:MAG TPA: (d)CMP kinase [Pyrinomonadaceae bacterium]|nr:(d)CMP kinase [Pyrinomonadaceae bacterium]
MTRPLIIAIDGPSSAGKTTLSRLLARELGLLHLDTGSMYRAVALAVLEAGVNISDEAAVGEVAARAAIRLEGDPDSMRVWLDGRDVSDKIRSEQITHASSVVSTIPRVRRELVGQQREMGARGGVVLNGRDSGTVVFPDADVKFFITAMPEERARRRYDEERPGLHDNTFEETLADINARDQRDSTRADSPLAIAEDAVVIDTTDLSIEDVFQRMLEVVRERQGHAREGGATKGGATD